MQSIELQVGTNEHNIHDRYLDETFLSLSSISPTSFKMASHGKLRFTLQCHKIRTFHQFNLLVSKSMAVRWISFPFVSIDKQLSSVPFREHAHTPHTYAHTRIHITAHQSIYPFFQASHRTYPTTTPTSIPFTTLALTPYFIPYTVACGPSHSSSRSYPPFYTHTSQMIPSSPHRTQTSFPLPLPILLVNAFLIIPIYPESHSFLSSTSATLQR
ncbi:hypothetical protein M501DRAFT_236199 [Patellaria atrata CBS 101060]|uniref:Uncharacterized protein n=1 Tax=Patellaria atrata CBS 101060 TaxID=1346257 RepID=A0A9P4VPL7_9PEZI|nr:hypothetical protein M501DRAFT_236199 [Patellaria atrata CBS 101060]